jgi:ornithine decarboxylase
MEDIVRRARTPRAQVTVATEIAPIQSTGAPVRKSIRTSQSVYAATPQSHPIWQLPTPSLLMSPARAVANYQSIQRAFPDAHVCYTVKSNAHPSILAALATLENAWFEVASAGEVIALANCGVRGERILYSNPVKQASHIKTAVDHGVTCFSFDSEAEIEKLAVHADRTEIEVYCRMTVPHSGALWPLTHKFGVEPRRAVDLLKLARGRGLKPVGLAFHVGSQCVRPETWGDALRTIAPAWHEAQDAGLDLDLLNLGGGFSAPYTGPVPPPSAIAAVVNPLLQDMAPGAKRIMLEPGRGVSATAGDMVLEVVGVAQRPDGQTWLYLDGGYFSGLYEIPDGIRPSARPITRDTRPARMQTYRLAGPTCDSIDKLFEMRSPVEMKVGDRLLLKMCGSYVYGVGSPFNGFEVPAVLNADTMGMDLDELTGIC